MSPALKYKDPSTGQWVQLLSGAPVEQIGMVRARMANSWNNYGAAMSMLPLVQDYVKGTTGWFTISGGYITVSVAGVYLIAVNITCGGGGGWFEGKAADSTQATNYCRTTAPSSDGVMSASDVRWLNTGATIGAWFYNASGLTNIQGDTAANPTALSVTKLLSIP